MRWLLTGAELSPSIPADHPAIGRIAKLLGDHPDASGPLMAFVDILAESLSWSAKPCPDEAQAEAVESIEATGESSRAAQRSAASQSVGLFESSADHLERDWIPILGRSAAGVPQFWENSDDAAGVTVLSDLVERFAGRSGGRVIVAVATDESGKGDQSAQLITMTDPVDDSPAEFVVAGSIKHKHPDAFAVRIDGDSMSPAIRHGDVVICSASDSASDGSAAVVQLSGQIGVTCKVFRRAGDTVHLIPVNEQYAPQSFPTGDVVWARRVLARVRPGQ